ncbi:MAG TPA: hypothetical protein VEH31_26150, partial [Streptosporangiaceae bacterium]|nr:hypothetical protein [Streptosporangiaceae bacterium]
TWQRQSGRLARWYPTAPPPGNTALPLITPAPQGKDVPSLIAHHVVSRLGTVTITPAALNVVEIRIDLPPVSTTTSR